MMEPDREPPEQVFHEVISTVLPLIVRPHGVHARPSGVASIFTAAANDGDQPTMMPVVVGRNRVFRRKCACANHKF